jgi:hypothetical protein
MNTEKTIFETGATSSAVNELILYTDNTGKLAEHRDVVYMQLLDNPNINYPFHGLLSHAILHYQKEFRRKAPIEHIRNMTAEQRNEYCQIYANRFHEWKRERERNPQ